MVSLNVCGLRSKCIFPEFQTFLKSYDIIGFQETKTDRLDDITLEHFNLYYKHRKNYTVKHRSGGIALACRKSINQFVNVIDTKSSTLVCNFKPIDKNGGYFVRSNIYPT